MPKELELVNQGAFQTSYHALRLRGISHADISSALGCSCRHLARIVKGDSKATFEHDLRLFSLAVGVNREEVLNRVLRAVDREKTAIAITSVNA